MATQALSVVRGPALAEEEGLGELTLSGWFKHVCTQGQDAEALVFYENGLANGQRISWTYSQLWDEAQAVARALIASGLGKGGRVGIMMTNRPEFLAATFGTALAGGVATTFSTFSTPAELDYLIQASGVSILLFDTQILKKNYADILGELDPQILAASKGRISSNHFPFLTKVVGVGSEHPTVEHWSSFVKSGDQIDPAQVEARAATNTPADPAVLFFSSGSTAKPKGILSAHRGVTLQLWRWPKWYDAEKGKVRTWSANGFFWSGNFSMALGGALTSGGSLVLQSTFQAEEALALIEREKATMILAWPHQWEQLIAAPNWATVDLSSLIYMDSKSPIAQHPTAKLSWREPYAAYGNTETFTLSTVFAANTSEEDIGGSHGKPCHGNVFKIIDPLTGVTMPLGEKGEICVKGATMMLGYIGTPLDETLDEEGFLRTGDGGWFDEQNRLHWQGRLNDIVKTGGANVSPVEIDTILKQIPDIMAVQTVGVPHESLGELVVACVVRHQGSTLSAEDVKAHAKEYLASFKVPREVLFFTEDELTLTGSAKIKTADLRKIAAEKLGE